MLRQALAAGVVAAATLVTSDAVAQTAASAAPNTPCAAGSAAAPCEWRRAGDRICQYCKIEGEWVWSGCRGRLSDYPYRSEFDSGDGPAFVEERLDWPRFPGVRLRGEDVIGEYMYSEAIKARRGPLVIRTGRIPAGFGYVESSRVSKWFSTQE
ncbi:hypothetical protein Misp01_10710 [Microtetraspora sp. NBRC 13810]|uniref:hypothetical protein n=1 Tax=Microtetraspora sp. NBRC 13810 TaxID=3030990 RepID=UPI0024A06B0D|nr:hypothetical protein [Microtetraspora sp. NBRC 13810]GLW05941.1 hypothetical protein Misp01_10710 [Microtetraspora sp. NBRC 13810]